MPDIPSEIAEGEPLSVSRQWNPMVRAMRRLSEGDPPEPQNDVDLYELTAAMEYDATAKQWKATAKPVYRHPVNELYELDDDGLEETIWAPCSEQSGDEASDDHAPFDSGDRVFTYMLFAHREILHQGRRCSAWNGHLNADDDIAKTASSELSWTQDNVIGYGITHSGASLTLVDAGWYDVDLGLCFAPDEGANDQCAFDIQLLLDASVIWRMENETPQSGQAFGADSRGYSYKFPATAGQVLKVKITNGNILDVTMMGNSSAADIRCHLSIAQIR
jgi:hypothetical protein